MSHVCINKHKSTQLEKDRFIALKWIFFYSPQPQGAKSKNAFLHHAFFVLRHLMSQNGVFMADFVACFRENKDVELCFEHIF